MGNLFVGYFVIGLWGGSMIRFWGLVGDKNVSKFFL